MSLIRNVAAAILFFPAVVLAKPLVLATFTIPLMVETPDKGLFISLTREIAKRNSRAVDIVVLPTGKTLLAFSNAKVDGFFPALDVYVPKTSAKSSPFYHKVDYVFYRKSSPLRSIKDLEGKKVGLTFRYPYGKDLINNKKIKFEYAADDVLNMRKLGQGLIDAFVVEERSGLKALQLSGERGIEFDKTQPLSEQTVYYAFHDNEEGRKLAALFSKTIEDMKKDGSLDRVLTEAAQSPP
ncbi:transporter substrate-binding domain-containing protein [Bdellovibrio bacteriovorus]|uniref:substrate-binding periplasmic protein n=1 Tax=Bdellovibrio bacteriovorus TaxID=959 RepID=UPI0021CEAFCF|nr:transporter substrate-binding domain-containing protein [Bdellovibrio bacteriovorus]UXR63551.1 transporter substrate-binding domain-containing protein [Bdellovibrio bacteriovorus]